MLVLSHRKESGMITLAQELFNLRVRRCWREAFEECLAERHRVCVLR